MTATPPTLDASLVEEIRRALEPFANLYGGCTDDRQDSEMLPTNVLVREIRAARAVLSRLTTAPSGWQNAEKDELRAVIRRRVMDCSTSDFYEISDEGVDNIALVAAEAVIEWRDQYSTAPSSGAPSGWRTMETAWLIEHGASEVSAPRYWGGVYGWTRDHLKAVRFSREADARSQAEAGDDGTPDNYRICEHIWDDGKSATPPSPEAAEGWRTMETARDAVIEAARKYVDLRMRPNDEDWAYKIMTAANALTSAVTVLPSPEAAEGLCEDCPPANYPTDVTRCEPCPRRRKGMGDAKRTV